MKGLVWGLALVMVAQNVVAEQVAEKPSYIAQNEETVLRDDKIYFFAHSMCQSCRDAYIYFNTKHRGLNIQITDMRDKHNLDLYKQCVKKFEVKNSELRLPLICMGNNYIMGWQKSSEFEFDRYLEEFLGK